MSINFWHERFTEQARWTENARAYIIKNIYPKPEFNLLEIGSGTGAVLNQLASEYRPVRYGVDLKWDYLQFNCTTTEKNHLIQADGIKLPFKDNFFDVVYCHFLLLWIDNPLIIIAEMKRVTKSGGWVCLFAEPDYLARIDSPQSLIEIGKFQNESLRLQGMHLDTGRNIKNFLINMKLTNINWGVLGAHESVSEQSETKDQEWQTLLSDLKLIFDEKKLNQIKADYLSVKNKKGGILFIPTFYAYGQKS